MSTSKKKKIIGNAPAEAIGQCSPDGTYVYPNTSAAGSNYCKSGSFYLIPGKTIPPNSYCDHGSLGQTQVKTEQDVTDCENQGGTAYFGPLESKTKTKH
jgi:hypothetical protein